MEKTGQEEQQEVVNHTTLGIEMWTQVMVSCYLLTSPCSLSL